MPRAALPTCSSRRGRPTNTRIRRRRPGAGVFALSGGADRLIELVPCLPVAEERLSVAGSRRRPAALRRGFPRRLRDLAQALAGGDGVCRAARNAELDGADRRDGDARSPPCNSGLHGDLYSGLRQVFPILPAVRGSTPARGITFITKGHPTCRALNI